MTAISSVGGSSSAWASMAARREARQTQMFNKVDSDGSGEVSGTELQSALDDIAARTGGDAASAQDLVKQYDQDGDGSLSQDELGAAMKSVLPPLSTTEFAQSRGGDGAPPPDGVAGAEGGGHHHGGGGGKVEGASSGSSSDSSSYDPLDTNQDGVVSADELAAAGLPPADGTDASNPLEALFQAADSDGNGKVSGSETDVLVQKIEQALSTLSTGGGTATASSSASGGSDASDSANGQSDPNNPPPFELQKLAQLVLQQYQQVASNDTSSSTAVGSTVSAVA